MKDLFSDGFNRFVDTLFNGRPASAPEPARRRVTIPELIRRGTSVVLVEGKPYRITVEPVEFPAPKRAKGDPA
jgi:hypothetical protein